MTVPDVIRQALTEAGAAALHNMGEIARQGQENRACAAALVVDAVLARLEQVGWYYDHPDAERPLLLFSEFPAHDGERRDPVYHFTEPVP